MQNVITLNGIDYEIKLNRHSRYQISKIVERQQQEMFQDSELMSMMARQEEIQQTIAELQEKEEAIKNAPKTKVNEKKAKEIKEEMIGIQMKLAPMLSKMQAIQDNIDKYEVLYIVISSNKKNPPISRVMYEDGLDQLEEEIGIEEIEVLVNSIVDNLFTQANLISQKVQDRRQAKTN